MRSSTDSFVVFPVVRYLNVLGLCKDDMCAFWKRDTQDAQQYRCQMLLLKATVLFVALQSYTVRQWDFRKRKPCALLSAISKVMYLQQLCGFYWNLPCFYLFLCLFPVSPLHDRLTLCPSPLHTLSLLLAAFFSHTTCPFSFRSSLCFISLSELPRSPKTIPISNLLHLQ